MSKDTHHVPRQHVWIDRDTDKYPSLHEWQEAIYKNSVQVKDIYDKYKISDEHPGLQFSLNLSGNAYPVYKRHLGTFEYARASARHDNEPSWYAHGGIPLRLKGPTYFGSPLNEDCHIKALASLKYATLLSVPHAFFLASKLDGHLYLSSAGYMRSAARRYWQVWKPNGGNAWCVQSTFAALFAVTLGTTWCVSAMIREKDDVVNTTIAAFATGAAMAVRCE